MTTTVIDLYGGPGCGKSTTAAGLFHLMKLKGYSVELVREYVKNWAWDGRKVGEFDTPYLIGKQFKYEATCYNKVDYIITDAPIWNPAFYEKFYEGTGFAIPMVSACINFGAVKGVTHKSFLLSRKKLYDPRGRYQDLEGAKALDVGIKKFLEENTIPYTLIDNADEERHKAILCAILGNEVANDMVQKT